MTPHLNHPYGLRAWIRVRLPWWAIRMGLADKGADCHRVGAAHRWYNTDGQNSGCYYCRVERPGKLWLPPPVLHELDVVRVVAIHDPSGQAEVARDYERPPRIGDEGIIVSLPTERGPVAVENPAPDGSAIWLTTFDPHELEVVRCHLADVEGG